MNALSKKNKLFIVITLALLVIGMAIFGIFNFNQMIDHKDSYEVRVGVEQKAGNALTVLECATEEYFEEKGVKPESYATQKMDDGKTIVYKFATDVKIDEEDLQNYLQQKLDADDSITDLTAMAEYNSVIGYDEFNVGWILLGLAIGVVATFIYALIMEKLSGAVATACVSIVSLLMFISVVAMTRIPAYPVFGATACLATITGAVLSIATVSRCNQEFKKVTGAKPNVWAITDVVMKKEVKKYVYTAVAFLVGAIAISAFFVPNMIVVGGQVLIAGLVGLAMAYFGAPLMWALVKGRKSSKA